MPYCRHCGAPYNDGAATCSYCGETIENPVVIPVEAQPTPTAQYEDYSQYQRSAPINTSEGSQIVDSGSIGWSILGFFLPLVGLILFFAWKAKKPNCAKKALVGAIIGIVLNIVSAAFA